MQNSTFFGHYRPWSIIVLNKTDSTNDYLKQLVSNFKPLPSLTAIMAKNQTDGRGQRGNSWVSAPNQNLTVSILLNTKSLPIVQQFYLTIISSLAVYETLNRYVIGKICIKWPNDIYINNRKCAGLLIENKIQGQDVRQSIIGIGINILQTEFPGELASKATSLKLQNPILSYNFIDIIRSLQQNLSVYYKMLDNNEHSKLLTLYNEVLFQKNEKKKYLINNALVMGEILGVEEDGLLKMRVDDSTTKYDLKDIAYQL